MAEGERFVDCTYMYMCNFYRLCAGGMEICFWCRFLTPAGRGFGDFFSEGGTHLPQEANKVTRGQAPRGGKFLLSKFFCPPPPSSMCPAQPATTTAGHPNKRRTRRQHPQAIVDPHQNCNRHNRRRHNHQQRRRRHLIQSSAKIVGEVVVDTTPQVTELHRYPFGLQVAIICSC